MVNGSCSSWRLYIQKYIGSKIGIGTCKNKTTTKGGHKVVWLRKRVDLGDVGRRMNVIKEAYMKFSRVSRMLCGMCSWCYSSECFFFCLLLLYYDTKVAQNSVLSNKMPWNLIFFGVTSDLLVLFPLWSKQRNMWI